jgi:hypothetical protein
LGKLACVFCKGEQSIFADLQEITEKIYVIMTTVEDYEIREGALCYFYSLASAIGAQFEPYFDKLIEFALKSAEAEDGVTYDKEKKDEFSLDTDSEDEGNGAITTCNVKTT